MPYLTTFGIDDEDGGTFISALTITDEISVLLQQQGIDPDSVNKLNIPAGFGNVGTMSILCYLPPSVELPDAELIAIAGPIKWPLSRSYRVHRIFASSEWVNEVRETLAVLTFDDWRYGLQFESSGSTDENAYNQYSADWAFRPPGDDEIQTELEGLTPLELGGISGSQELNISNLGHNSLNNTFNAWDYNTNFSRGSFVDKIFTSCGVLAVPYPLLREGYGQHTQLSRQSSQIMNAQYIGDGWYNSQLNWEEFREYYINGQSQVAYGEISVEEGGVGDMSEVIGDDDMIDNLADVPLSGNYSGAFGEYDGKQGVPDFLNIQFPAKDTATGKIIMYLFRGVRHGMPSDNAVSYTEGITITDHVKTRVTINEEDFQQGFSDGITIIEVEDGQAIGLDEQRLAILADRALHLSRTYYSRYYASTGTVKYMGFQLLRPWAGQQQLEYGFSNGMPYTKWSGEIDYPLYGFNQSDFSKSTVISSGGIMMSRPDGITDLALSGAGGAKVDILAKVTQTLLDGGACFPTYVVQPIGTGLDIGPLIPTSREVPNMCYQPAPVGTLCLLALDPEPENPENPKYVFIIEEKVQTQECG